MAVFRGRFGGFGDVSGLVPVGSKKVEKKSGKAIAVTEKSRTFALAFGKKMTLLVEGLF